MDFLLWTKGSHENTNFDTFKCSNENLPNSSCQFSYKKLVFLQILHDSSVSWNITSLYFLGQTLYTLHKRDQSKWRFYRFFSALIKVHQILVIFGTKNCFFLQTLQHSLMSWEITLFCTFWSKLLYALDKRIQSKCKFSLHTFDYLHEN